MKHKRHTTLGAVVTLVMAGIVSLPAATPTFGGEIYNYQIQPFHEVEHQRGLPVRGMSEKMVRSRYGEPMSKKAPVGNPPISIWYYDEFNVYFERHLVITTVSKQDFLPAELNQIQ